HWSNSPFGEVTFTLTRVLHDKGRKAAGAPSVVQPPVAAEGTFVTDITHYLDEAGEVAQLPGPARELASFLTQMIEAATGTASTHYHDTRIRCRSKACPGTILTFLPPSRDEISWHCSDCGHNGVIRNWQKTKWNQLRRAEQPG